MARKRMIDPNIWISEDFSKLSPHAQIVFISIFSHADDFGYGMANTSLIRSVTYPYGCDGIDNDVVSDLLDEIAKYMSILFYEKDGKEYYLLKNWRKFQRVDKPKASQIPHFGSDCTPIRGCVAEQFETDSRPVAEEPGTCREKVTTNIREIENKENMNTNEKEKVEGYFGDAEENLSLVGDDKKNDGDNEKQTYGEYSNVLLTGDEVSKLQDKFIDWQARIEELSEGIELKGYRYNNHYAAILKWDKNNRSRGGKSKQERNFDAARNCFNSFRMVLRDTT